MKTNIICILIVLIVSAFADIEIKGADLIRQPYGVLRVNHPDLSKEQTFILDNPLMLQKAIERGGEFQVVNSKKFFYLKIAVTVLAVSWFAFLTRGMLRQPWKK